MNRCFVLAMLGVMVGGCAADFGEDPVDTADVEQGEPQVFQRSFNGEVFVQQERLIPVDEAKLTLTVRGERGLRIHVDDAKIELGPLFARSENP